MRKKPQPERNRIMVKIKTRLLGSAPTKEQLLIKITQFYYGSTITIYDDGRVSTLKGICNGVRVVQKNHRWRFERIIE